ncbi:MAG TPA: S-layer homology domain-containing protein, partial [Clostridiales bacterium]|nr:S-layer homology domain-containing protein [Clostridiales bacterium]
RPLAPTDFSVAVGPDGELLLSDNSVTFSWTHREKDVIYQLVRTTGRVHPMAEQSEFENDPVYLGFLDEYNPPQSGKDPSDRGVFLDPEGDPQQNFPGKFTYDRSTGLCTFTVDRGMFPNRLYYFSIRAIKVDTGRKPVTPPSNSVWVSIPVTTSLLEAPGMLEAVPVAEIGFFWTDTDPAAAVSDYTIHIKGPGDASYRALSKAQATIVKDPDGKTYYGRVTGLKHGTTYDVKVTKGSGITVYEKMDFMTRDGYHELEIKWMGKQLDDYAGYEIAIMEEGGSEYTVLTAADLEWYIDKNGRVQPYYTEETARTVNDDRLYYYARIKSMDVTLPGGIVTKQPLKSNTRYYIKVRAKKKDPVYTDIISYSKYTGPVSIRTEFSQKDYDDTDRRERQREEFLDKMEQFEKGYFWRIAIGSSNITSIMLKGDRIADAMRHFPGDSFLVDISEISVNIERDEIYIPVALLEVMKSLKKSLIIRSDGTEIVIRPYTLDAVFNETVKGIRERQEVRELYIKLDLRRENRTDSTLPSGMIPVSAVNGLEIQALGFSITYEDMASMFHDKLYNKDTGLVNEKLSLLLNTYVGSGTGSAALTDQYTRNLVDLIEKELSIYIDNTIKTIKLTNTIREIPAFDAPLSVKLKTGESNVLKSAYVRYKGTGSWQKVTMTESGSVVMLELLKPGMYVILVPGRGIGGIPEDHWARNYILKMAAKYDLESVFKGAGANFMPEVKVTSGEIVLLYELVTGMAPANTGLNIRSKLAELGLDDLLHPNSLAKDASRQQTAAVLARLLAVRKGTDPRSLRPRTSAVITDERDIDDQYYMSVLIVIDVGVMQLDASGRFRPKGTMTRAEAVAAFARLLELTGDL